MVSIANLYSILPRYTHCSTSAFTEYQKPKFIVLAKRLLRYHSICSRKFQGPPRNIEVRGVNWHLVVEVLVVLEESLVFIFQCPIRPVRE